MANLRKVISINDDINSARSFLRAISSAKFQKLDLFKDLRKTRPWTLSQIKEEVSQAFASRHSDEILILDIELATDPQDGIALLEWFRGVGFTQPVFVYSGHISRLDSVEDAKSELLRLGLTDDLIWSPIIDSQLNEIEDALITSTNIPAHALENIKNKKTIPWRFEYFQEISLSLLIPDDENVQKVKFIIGLDEENGKIEGAYEKCSQLNDTEQETFRDIKNNIADLVVMPADANFHNNEQFFCLYMNIYGSLAHLCRDQMKMILAA